MQMHCDARVKQHNLNNCLEQRGDKGIKARLTNRVWHVQSLSLIMPPLLQTAPLLWSKETWDGNKRLQQTQPISELCAVSVCYERVWDPSGIKLQTLRFKLKSMSVFPLQVWRDIDCSVHSMYWKKNPLKHYVIDINIQSITFWQCCITRCSKNTVCYYVAYCCRENKRWEWSDLAVYPQGETNFPMNPETLL